MHLRTQLRLSAACLLICALLCTCGAWATGIQVDFLLAGLRHPDTDEPLTGGKVYSYAAGTATPKALYTDAAMSVAASNPVVLSAYGQANVYASGKYKLVVKDSDDVTLLTLDNLEYSSVTTYFTDTTDPFGQNLTQTNLTVHNLTASLSTNLNAASYTVTNLAEPVMSHHAATKNYVDTRVYWGTATPTVTTGVHIIWYDENTATFKGYASGTWVNFH